MNICLCAVDTHCDFKLNKDFKQSEEQKEAQFQEIKRIIMTCIKEAIAGEIADDDNASSGVEEILRCGYIKVQGLYRIEGGH